MSAARETTIAVPNQRYIAHDHDETWSYHETRHLLVDLGNSFARDGE